MKRLSAVIWALVIIGGYFLLYMVKYQAQTLHTQVAEASRQLEAEKESLHVVAAEWAYLNRPERLRQLASQYLMTSGLTADRIAELEAIPEKQNSAVQPASLRVSKNFGAAK